MNVYVLKRLKSMEYLYWLGLQRIVIFGGGYVCVCVNMYYHVSMPFKGGMSGQSNEIINRT